MLWLYLRLPRLQLDTQAPNEQRPIAVVDERDNRVVQLNEAARTEGITLTMGLATAAALCRGVQLLPYQPLLEERRLEELAQGLYDLCGDISLDSPCGMWLGASRMVKYHNGFDNYCKKICQFLVHRQLFSKLTAGYSPLAAKLLSQAPAEVSGGLQACQASLWQAVRRAPLSASELPPKTQEHLRRLGISTLGALLDIPFKALSQRFDQTVAQYIGRLDGRLPHPLPFYQPPEDFRRHRELPHELDATGRLLPWVNQLLAELEDFLNSRNQVVERIELTLLLRQRDPLVLTIGAARGESQAARWQPLVQLTLERQPLEAPVCGLILSAKVLRARSEQHEDLLDEHPGAAMTPPQLVALLQARLGHERVRGLALADDFRPLRASVESAPLAALSASRPDTDAPPALRPAFLLESPQVYRQPLDILEGPERITTGWWDGEPQVRDYYIVRNAQGQWCWAFRDPNQPEWFLQGYFS